jgi:hypothetical protein
MPETGLPRASCRIQAMPTSDAVGVSGDADGCATRTQLASARNPSREKRQCDTERDWCSTKGTGRIMWRMFTPRVGLSWDGDCYMPVRKKAPQENSSRPAVRGACKTKTRSLSRLLRMTRAMKGTERGTKKAIRNRTALSQTCARVFTEAVRSPPASPWGP